MRKNIYLFLIGALLANLEAGGCREVDDEDGADAGAGAPEITGDTATEGATGGATTNGTVCGDGQVNPGEQCDDGNTNNNDACTNDCSFPETL